ncbi:hypothetical protein QA649_29885 [Bradyrhizobium sp. CB1717]|uniref:hypothetical protein n=1 Tax=Bradyrhizobium sp. CB1717 TaxID=3039154 RepID=UPI0024B10387|nr:hypothetical protein [Bradyrhizobium sp. CB1717]WFU22275.1 hypothetical protein QA649_29885 [Bradyrhizobium sp. CB1717]
MTCTTLLAVFTLGACNGLAGNDEMDRYFQRSDTLTLSAGDAKQVNAATHTINPWPRGVGDRRIVVDAGKTTGAIRRYRSGNQPRDPLPAFGGNKPDEGHPPMGVAGATAAAVDAGGVVSLGGGPAIVGVSGR